MSGEDLPFKVVRSNGIEEVLLQATNLLIGRAAYETTARFLYPRIESATHALRIKAGSLRQQHFRGRELDRPEHVLAPVLFRILLRAATGRDRDLLRDNSLPMP